MIRNKLQELNSRKRGRAVTSRQAVEAVPYISWEIDYYHSKDELQSIARTNQQLQQLLNQYRATPSVFFLKQIDHLIKMQSRNIDEIDSWLRSFPYTPDSPTHLQIEQRLTAHMKQELLSQIKLVFSCRDQLAQITASQWPATPNQSFRSHHSHNEEAERTQAMREVTLKIENLSALLRRMGEVASEQGGLVDRIDLNLLTAQGEVRKGKRELQQRLRRESPEEEGEFSCSGRANQAIMSLYFINLALILVFLIKNL